MKNLHDAMRNMAAITIGRMPAGGRVCFGSNLYFLARGLVFLASGLVVAGAAMSADSRLSGAQYREAVNDVNASYRAELLQCNTKSRDDRARCRSEARAARTEALAAAKAMRAFGTAESVDTPKPPNPEIPSGLNASKADIEPKLQRDSPPDIIAPKKK